MTVKRKQVEQMNLMWMDPEATRGWHHTRLMSRSHDIWEHGYWAVLGKREPTESESLGQ